MTFCYGVFRDSMLYFIITFWQIGKSVNFPQFACYRTEMHRLGRLAAPPKYTCSVFRVVLLCNPLHAIVRDMTAAQSADGHN